MRLRMPFSSFQAFRALLFALVLHLLAFGSLRSQTSDESFPLALADIEKVFGKGFTAEKPTKLGEILSRRFSGKKFTIQASIQPSYGIKKVDEYLKLAPPNQWKPIPNDPDGAMIEVRDDKSDDLASTPAIAYIRKDKYVRLQILGNYYDNRAQMPKLRDEMRDKLAKLRRIP